MNRDDDQFLEDPFVYPDMYCPLCGLHMLFPVPFKAITKARCPKCRELIDVPDPIIEKFLNNIEFADYISREGRGSDGPAPSPIV